MSDRGDSTRDWLLKKMLKMKESLVEQSQELKAMGKRLGEANSLAQDLEGQMIRDRKSYHEDRAFFDERIRQMAPGKQFTVIYRSAGRFPVKLNILSVSTANGETTITVERG